MSVRFDHMNLTVRNLDESISWYGKLFGFEKVESGVGQTGNRWAIIACNDSMIAMTEHSEKSKASQREQEDHRIYHFGIRVPDSNEWRSKVKTHGIKLHYGGEIQYPHSRSWYVHDPSGHEIEVSCTEGKSLRFPTS